MYEAREDRDGTYYVIEGVSGHLAHSVTPEGDQKAAVGLPEGDAWRLADQLNREG